MRDGNGPMLSEECGYSDICVWGGEQSVSPRANKTAETSVDLQK